MADRNIRKELAGLLIAPLLGVILASATIVPPERVATALAQKATDVTEECKEAPKRPAQNSAANRAPQEMKKSTEAGHPRPDPIKHLLRGILL
jgi:hypothetical protein